MEKKKYNFPEVKLGQYKGLAITRHVRPVTEKTLDIEMVHQTRMHATYRPTQEPAKRGCRALLDFAGYMDGKEIPDSRMEKVMVVLGDGKLMPAAEQAIYGHRAGETFRFDFTYPAEFRRSLQSPSVMTLSPPCGSPSGPRSRRSMKRVPTAPPASACWKWPGPTSRSTLRPKRWTALLTTR